MAEIDNLNATLSTIKTGMANAKLALAEKGVDASNLSITNLGSKIRLITGGGGSDIDFGAIELWLTENGYSVLIPWLVDSFKTSATRNADNSKTWADFRTQSLAGGVSMIIDPNHTVTVVSDVQQQNGLLYIGENVDCSTLVTASSYFARNPNLTAFKPRDFSSLTSAASLFIKSGIVELDVYMPVCHNFDSAFSEMPRLKKLVLTTNNQFAIYNYSMRINPNLEEIWLGKNGDGVMLCSASSTEATVGSLSRPFNENPLLRAIYGTIDVSLCSSFSYVLSGNYALEEIRIANLYTTGLDFRECLNLSVDSMVFMFENAQTVTGSKYIYLGTTNLAKLTAAQKAIATGKGWTLS